MDTTTTTLPHTELATRDNANDITLISAAQKYDASFAMLFHPSKLILYVLTNTFYYIHYGTPELREI
jgi:hypothetical protein